MAAMPPGAAPLHSALSRRAFLSVGGAGVVALAGRPARTTRAEGAGRPPIKACILLFQPGGPSHIDVWDMKPAAPAEIRGEFAPIATSVPGVQICEHLPRLARLADKLAIVRSLHHGMRDHNAAAVEMLCGHTPREGDVSIFADHANSFPCYGSAISRLLGASRPGFPAHVALPHVVTRVVKLPGQEPGFLGPAYSPFQIAQDPSAAEFEVAELILPPGVAPRRLADRQSLRRQLNGPAREASDAARARDVEASYDRAFALLGSDEFQRSFDLSSETQATRERYSLTRHGQSVLLARRLVEAGVRFVTVNFAHGDADIGGGDDWDTHFKNFSILREICLPPVDLAFSALVEDLEARGLLDSTLILWLGEFGRTPSVTRAEGGGRDHWPNCFSAVLAGGGVLGGAVLGASDKHAAFPISDPVSCGDLAATLFWRFGLDLGHKFYDLIGRPVPLAAGRPLERLFA